MRIWPKKFKLKPKHALLPGPQLAGRGNSVNICCVEFFFYCPELQLGVIENLYRALAQQNHLD